MENTWSELKYVCVCTCVRALISMIAHLFILCTGPSKKKLKSEFVKFSFWRFVIFVEI